MSAETFGAAARPSEYSRWDEWAVSSSSSRPSCASRWSECSPRRCSGSSLRSASRSRRTSSHGRRSCWRRPCSPPEAGSAAGRCRSPSSPSPWARSEHASHVDGRGCPPRGPWRATLRDPILATLAVAVAAAAVYLAAVAFLTTPNDWDGLTYHETRALLWDQQGGIGYVPAGNDPRLNGNPPVSEIGLYLTMMLPRSERFAALTQFLALWASVVAVVLIGRRLGLSPRGAAYGGLVFATLPLVALHGASILNDVVVASFLLAAVAFLLDRGTSSLVLGAVALGLALGTKLNAVLSLPLVILVVIAGVPRERRMPAALALVGGVLLGSPWYLVNLAETGSLDGDLATSTGQKADLSFGVVVGTLRALAFDVVDTSGFWRTELYVAVVVGAALVGCGRACVAAVSDPRPDARPRGPRRGARPARASRRRATDTVALGAVLVQARPRGHLARARRRLDRPRRPGHVTVLVRRCGRRRDPRRHRRRRRRHSTSGAPAIRAPPRARAVDPHRHVRLRDRLRPVARQAVDVRSRPRLRCVGVDDPRALAVRRHGRHSAQRRSRCRSSTRTPSRPASDCSSRRSTARSGTATGSTS